jgi:hypothetical protein
MATVELFECEQAVTIREIASEATRLTGLRVTPALVRKIRRGLAAQYAAQPIDHIEQSRNPWMPNGHVGNTGRVGPSYTFGDFRAKQLLRAVVQHVQTKYTRPDGLTLASSPFGFF